MVYPTGSHTKVSARLHYGRQTREPICRDHRECIHERLQCISEHRSALMRKRRELNDIYKDHCDRQESFSRIVFFSRKAAKLMHYDNTLRIGEDAYQMHQLRKLNHDGVIDMRTRKERQLLTYVQLADRSSITRNVTSSGDIIINYDWMELTCRCTK